MRTFTRPARLLAVVALLALYASGCGPSGNPNAAATVNGEEITIEEVTARFEALSQNEQFAQQLESDTEGTLEEQVQARLLSELIDSAVVRQGARELGVEITDEDVEQRREELIEEVGGQEQFDQIVDESGMTPEQITAQIRDIALREQVQEQLGADIEVPQEEIESFFEENRERRFNTIEARHILVETEEEAQDILQRLEDGEDFAEIAQAESIDTASGEQGGELGEFARGQMVPEFEEAAFNAEVGEVVGPVESQFGFHIIEVLGRNEPELADVEDDIRAELSDSQVGEAIQAWLAEQYEAAEIEVNPRFGEWDPDSRQVIPESGPLGGTGGPPPAEGGDTGVPEDAPTDG